MENNNYAESGDSSPRSRDIDCENSSWDDQPSNYRVKFMCSYGGKIQPRQHDNQLTYLGGDTKILAVDRNIKFSDLMSKLSSFTDSGVIFKYQLPGEDLDALISVSNDEDLEHMMAEYDRVHRISPKPPRLRLFLFLQKPKSYDSNGSNSKPNQQWLVDAVNSVPIQSLDSPAVKNPSSQDFLFGLDKSADVNAAKLPESEIPVGFTADISGRSDYAVDDRSVGETMVSPTISPAEIQRQIHELQRMQIANQEQELQRMQIANQEQELQRMQIANQEQAMFRKNSDEALTRAFHGDYYIQNGQEKPAPVASQPAYWQEMKGGYATGNEHPVYLMPSPAGMYQTSAAGQPVTGPPPAGMYTGQGGQISQGYYAMQRGPPDVYREQQVYGVGPPQPKIIARPGGVGGGIAVAEAGYTQVAYDSAGRQVYYTATPGSVMPTSYQTAVGTGGMDIRQVGALNVNPEGKVATTAAV